MNKLIAKQAKKAVDAEASRFAPKTVVGKVKEAANPDVALAGLRQLSTVIGALMLSAGLMIDANNDGLIDRTDVDLFIGAMLFLGGAGTSLWNAIKNYRRKKLLLQTQAMAPEVVKVAAATMAQDAEDVRTLKTDAKAARVVETARAKAVDTAKAAAGKEERDWP
jgi:hypothetical protein